MSTIKQLQIGNVTLKNNLILAPMAGVTDLPFRLLCKEQGAGLLCMEMVSAKAILYKNKNTEELLTIDPRENPVSLQLFGSDPDIISEIAKQMEDRPFDILDINMGCPVPKVVNNGDGSALMKNPKLAGEIIEKTVRAIKKPVTVKIRKGFDDDHVNAVEMAHIAEEIRCSGGGSAWKDQRAVLFRKSGLGYHTAGKRACVDTGHWKRGSSDGRGCDRHGETDRLRWFYDRKRSGGKSMDLPSDPALF